ncbi:MAG: SRPBCC family protein [Acidobacteria bacterium]|nr:SRPBCC family protein [Acidobacteriota bacterium]
MAEHILKRKLHLSVPRPQAFEFFADAQKLQDICPPELNFNIITPLPIDIQKDTLIDYKLHLRGIPIRWQTLISRWDPPNLFVDESLRGPYKQWIHTHTFTETEDGGTDIEDEVRYRLPFEPFGEIGLWFVKRELDYIFDYREKVITEYFE